jgi:hypothetical protein
MPYREAQKTHTPLCSAAAGFTLTYIIMYFTDFCMDIPITYTELARHLGDVLARVKHAGQSFRLT